MAFFDFTSYSLAVNAAVFGAAAAVIWFAGTRIARYADAIAEQTGIGREFLGLALLGAITSLPELAVASTASLAGVPALSVNDLLGSASLNILIIALADAVLGRDAITSAVGSPGLLLQGVLGIVLLAIVAAATMTPDVVVFGAGTWSWLLLALALAFVWVIAESEGRPSWIPANAPREPEDDGSEANRPGVPGSLRSLIARTAAAGVVVCIGGFLLARTGEAIAEQTGLGTSFVGAVLVAASTSLPEVSTVVAAVRLRRYPMALSTVLGTNIFNIIILFVVDALYAGGPVLAEVGRFAGFGALLAIVLTALFLAGMIERRDRTVARMGIDSIAAIICYGAGIVVLYQLR
jgi:cation:H+ antiporter